MGGAGVMAKHGDSQQGWGQGAEGDREQSLGDAMEVMEPESPHPQRPPPALLLLSPRLGAPQ